MKIALLNLQYDNNYGGNLQRYALMSVLQRMGHDVTHLNLRDNYEISFTKRVLRIPKRFVKKLLRDHNISLFSNRYELLNYKERCLISDPFYNKYIKHTNILTSKSDLLSFLNFDAYVVGSDQVWRSEYARMYGIDTFFFDWLPEDKKRFAYGISLGTDDVDFSAAEIIRLSSLYSNFDGVSVREKSALSVFNKLSWTSPKAEWVLDPTLLLSKDDYLELINDGSTIPSEGNMFCYILDPSNEKTSIIKEESSKRNLIPFNQIRSGKLIGIQQWLRSFYESDFVVTDSYHGLLFSIIFDKPFRLIRNKGRGNSRFDSIFELLGLSTNDAIIVDKSILDAKRLKSLNILKSYYEH